MQPPARVSGCKSAYRRRELGSAGRRTVLSKSHSCHLNVLGFLSKSGCLHSFPIQDKIKARYLVESIEALLPNLGRPTVLVLDNAPFTGQDC